MRYGTSRLVAGLKPVQRESKAGYGWFKFKQSSGMSNRAKDRASAEYGESDKAIRMEHNWDLSVALRKQGKNSNAQRKR
jgi:hypothetical protein